MVVFPDSSFLTDQCKCGHGKFFESGKITRNRRRLDKNSTGSGAFRSRRPRPSGTAAPPLPIPSLPHKGGQWVATDPGGSGRRASHPGRPLKNPAMKNLCLCCDKEPAAEPFVSATAPPGRGPFRTGLRYSSSWSLLHSLVEPCPARKDLAVFHRGYFQQPPTGLPLRPDPVRVRAWPSPRTSGTPASSR